MKILECHERIMQIMKIIEFHARITSKMKNLEFKSRITKVMKKIKKTIDNNKKNENLRIPFENQ